MFRRQRATEPDPVSRNLGNILKPMPIMIWGGQAMHYLGVPVVLGVNTGLGPHFFVGTNNPVLALHYSAVR